MRPDGRFLLLALAACTDPVSAVVTPGASAPSPATGTGAAGKHFSNRDLPAYLNGAFNCPGTFYKSQIGQFIATNSHLLGGGQTPSAQRRSNGKHLSRAGLTGVHTLDVPAGTGFVPDGPCAVDLGRLAAAAASSTLLKREDKNDPEEVDRSDQRKYGHDGNKSEKDKTNEEETEEEKDAKEEGKAVSRPAKHSKVLSDKNILVRACSDDHERDKLFRWALIASIPSLGLPLFLFFIWGIWCSPL